MPKKKPSFKAKFNDFNKFRESDKIFSDSSKSFSSEKEEEEEKNNINFEEQQQSKTIEIIKDKKNSIYNKFNDYFFDENVLNEEQLRKQKSKEIKEIKEIKKPNQNKVNKKKGFYHYQNNPPKKEEKNDIGKRFELVSRNITPHPRLSLENTSKESSHDKIKKMREGEIKKKKFVTKNTDKNLNENLSFDDKNEILNMKIQKGRNINNRIINRLNNNSPNYNKNMTTRDIKDKEINSSRIKMNKTKSNPKNKKKEIFQNIELSNNTEEINNYINKSLMNSSKNTMKEYSTIYTAQNTTFRGPKVIKGYIEKNKKNNFNSKSIFNNSKIGNQSNSRQKLINSKSKNINNSKTKMNRTITNKSKIDIIHKNKNSLNNSFLIGKKEKNLNHTFLTGRGVSGNKTPINRKKASVFVQNTNKDKVKKYSNKNDSKINLGNSNHTIGNIIKIKKSKENINNIVKEDELPLFTGQIDYKNVSLKNMEESIDDLKKKYKKNGYTCIKKGKVKFKFVKGPNIHNVEIMRLGNGLLYYNVEK